MSGHKLLCHGPKHVIPLSNGLQLTCRHRNVFFKYMSNGLFHIYWYGSSYQVHKNPNLQWSFMNKMFIYVWYKYIEDLVNLKLRYGFEMRTLTVEPENWVFWLLFVYFCAVFFKRRIFFILIWKIRSVFPGRSLLTSYRIILQIWPKLQNEHIRTSDAHSVFYGLSNALSYNLKTKCNRQKSIASMKSA